MSKQESVVMSWAKKPQLVIALGSFMISLFMLDTYVKLPGITTIVSAVSTNWLPTIEYCSYILGFFLMADRSVRNLKQKRKEWYLGILTLAVAIIASLGYMFGGGASNAVYHFIDINIKGTGQSAVFALHGFFILSSSLRALKMKSIELTSAIVLVILTLLYQVPVGELIWPGIAGVGQWLQDYILAGGSRAITVTAAVGSVIMAIRVLVGLDWDVYGFRRGKEGR